MAPSKNRNNSGSGKASVSDTSADVPDLQKLSRKRNVIEQRVHGFNRFIDTIRNVPINDLSDEQISELEIKLEKVEEIWHDYEEVQMSIEMNCTLNNLNSEYEFRERLEALMMKGMSYGKLLLKGFERNTNDMIGDNQHRFMVQQASEPRLDTDKIKLKEIHIPVFNSDFLKWLEFKDTFEALVHNNTRLPDILKYHHLRDNLTGEARSIIESLGFSAENYEIAWQTLCDRYDNSRLLVNNHLRAIFEIPDCTKESAKGLRDIIDTVKKHLRSLKVLNVPTEHWDAIIIFLISGKLDKVTIREWEMTKADKTLPSLDAFFDFLGKRANFLETMYMTHKSISSTSSDNKQRFHKKSFFVKDSKGVFSCNFCKQEHLIYDCKDFLLLSVTDRWKKIKELKLCANCLCTGHLSFNCKRYGCRVCKKKHSSLLHEERLISKEPDSHKKEDRTSSHLVKSDHEVGMNSSQTLSFANKVKTDLDQYVLLSTAKIKVCNKFGEFQIVRALLDSGSQSCFITEELCDSLGLDRQNTDTSVSGINSSLSYLNKKCRVRISSRFNDYSADVTCYVIPRITDDLPSYTFDVSKWKIPDNLLLADDCFNKSDKIDMLIDAGVFWSVLLDGKIDLGKNLPIFQNTAFGYIASGGMSAVQNVSRNTRCHFISSMDDEIKDNDLQGFWAIEEPNNVCVRSSEDTYCEEHFQKSFSRNDIGQFIVKIPWKQNPSTIGKTKQLAIKRFLRLENKFNSNNDFKLQYSDFIHEYINLNHMSIDKSPEFDSHSYFLPHHGVIKTDSLTTNLRVVFDGSAISTNGTSLNSIQYSGPAIQNDIMNILLRFREHPVVVVADISKMYRMILLHEDDKPMHKILWRDDPSKPLSVYKLNTVTYGTASAPFLAMRCIKQLAAESQERFGKASEIINRDMYVDDLISGFSNADEAIEVCDQINEILGSASFNLRKWSSNNEQFLENYKDNLDPLKVLNFGEHESVKTLGIRWSSKLDIFTFNVQINTSPIITKRIMLSIIAKIYDPLGLASCCIILVKIMIQALWNLKIGWDSEVPQELSKQWKKFQSTLGSLNEVKIPRFVLSDDPVLIELHGFSDASNKAYCAIVYARCLDSKGNIKVSLVCAKTKVGPVNSMTIPRMELCGCLLLLRLMNTVLNSITFKCNVYYWCDSQIVLYWLNTELIKLKDFVRNRVAEIQQHSDINNWNYVNTLENPADIGSRGIMPDKLQNCKLWFNGPDFLSTNFVKANFPDLNNISDTREFKKDFKVLVYVENNLNYLFQRYSSLSVLVRVIAYLFRFISNLKDHTANNFENKITGRSIKTCEFQRAKLFLIKLAQEESFPTEIYALKNNKVLPKDSRLVSLAPFLDEQDLLRVGGRLKKSSLSFDAKHPLLLDKRHVLSKLVLRHEHLLLHHAGPQLLLASVRQQYWIISGMSVAKSVVKGCVKCVRFKPRPVISVMADLPEHRVNVYPPFYITGLDYAGPFILKDRKGRGCKTYKAYICLFICFCTKSVHLELISSLTTDAFVAGLRRFCSRRGRPSHIYSDNGSNFVGAQRELKQLYNYLLESQDEITSSLASQGITWHFIPPNTPNFGGLWESNIKGVKFHLLRVIGETLLTYEEFSTFLVQIEATLNSRPLYAISSDPNDMYPLTPSHFLIGRQLNSIPDPLFEEDVRINQLSRYQLIQQLLHGFWKQWSKMYLNQLQQRKKWHRSNYDVKIGDLVLIKQDNLPPCKWNLGRIINIHPGEDKVIRVVTIKTSSGIIKRGVSKICPLPMADSCK